MATAGLAAGALAAGVFFAGTAGGEPAWRLTTAFEARARAEYFDHAKWSRDGGDAFLLRRFLLSGDLAAGDRFRLYAQLIAGEEKGRDGGPRPTDEDRLDLHQAFADWQPFGAGGPVLRLGRQELGFGSQRLVSTRKGPNIPRSFDGLDLIAQLGGWRLDAFAARPVETDRGVFDDGPEHDRGFWGIYAVGPFPFLDAAGIDLYYLGLDRKKARYDQGIAAERRSTAGLRLFRQEAPWDYNFEAVYQWGSFGAAPIEAYTFASDTGFTFAAARWRPRLGLKADITSGDRDSRRPALQSFHPLFPRGSYFGENQLIGPINHIDLHPSLELRLPRRVTMTVSWDFFWRQSRADGLYDVAGNLVRSGAGTTERFVGSQPSLGLSWDMGHGLTLAARAEYFLAGAFLRESGPGEDVTFVTTSLSYVY